MPQTLGGRRTRVSRHHDFDAVHGVFEDTTDLLGVSLLGDEEFGEGWMSVLRLLDLSAKAFVVSSFFVLSDCRGLEGIQL